MNLGNIQLSRKQLITIILAALGILLVTIAVWFFATHGIVRITKQADGEYTFFNLKTEAYADGIKSKSSFMIVGSGEYAIELKQDGNLIQKNFTVPSWLQSVEVNLPTPTQRKVERIAGGTLDNIIERGGTLYSVSPTGLGGSAVLTHRNNDPSGNASGVKNLAQANSFGVVSNNTLIAFQGGGDVLQPVIYDKGPVANPSIITAPGGDTSPHIIPSSTTGNNRFAITYDNAYMQIFEGKNIIQTLGALSDAGKSSLGFTVAAVSSDVAAVGFGADSSEVVGDEHQGEEEELQPTGDYLVKIYDLKSGTNTKTLNLGRDIVAENLTITDDGSRIAVESNGRLYIYDTNSSKLLFTFEGSAIKTTIWTSNDQLIFSDQVSGLMRYDNRDRSVTTLFSPGELTVDDFTISGNKLLFTATNGSGDVRSSVSGYALYLDQEATDNNALIGKLPYTDNDIKITTLNGVIYASPNAFVKPPDNSNIGLEFYKATLDASIKQKIDNYIKNSIPNSENYQIVYGNNL